MKYGVRDGRKNGKRQIGAPARAEAKTAEKLAINMGRRWVFSKVCSVF